MKTLRVAPLVLFAAIAATAQTAPAPVWTMQESGTTAGLRGIFSVDGNVAWASGTGGTVLRTIDGGAHWTRCATPDADNDGANLDFRGVQAWDEKSAIVMASGPGDKSRLYETRDGCRSWSLIAANEDKDGFWDALKLWTPTDGFLAGDPVENYPFLSEFTSYNGRMIDNMLYFLPARKGEAAFAASNSVLALGPFNTTDGSAREVWFLTSGPSGSRLLHYQHFNGGEPERVSFSQVDLPAFPKSEWAGAFAIALFSSRFIAVGGDYTKPNESSGTAAYSTDAGEHWTASTTPPHGYRSAVQWSESLKLWITVGTNGSDLSRDDGKTWQPLDDGNWNAFSLPFVVGPDGRIAKLNAATLPKP